MTEPMEQFERVSEIAAAGRERRMTELDELCERMAREGVAGS